MDSGKPNLGRFSRVEKALGRMLLKAGRATKAVAVSAEQKLREARSSLVILWQEKLLPGASQVRQELDRVTKIASKKFTPLYVGLKVSASALIEVSGAHSALKSLRSKLRKLSGKEKDFLLQSLVVSIFMLPILTLPFFNHQTAGKVDGGEGSIGLLSSLAKSRQRYALVPSRGTAPAHTATAPATPAAIATPPAPAPAPPQDPNLPPELTQNTQNINPTLLTRFDAFRTFIFQQFHVVIEIKSGWRSTAEQAQLYATLPAGMAYPPGHSQHEKGMAIDYTPFAPAYNQYLGQFGLKAPYAGKEDWHVEIVEPH